MQVDGLENLIYLEHLYLNHNSIRELDPGSFASLQNLRVLHMGDNSLKSLMHLDGLITLESLDVTSNGLICNRLGGFTDYLSPLPKLTKLWLNNNPVMARHMCEILVAWEQKGYNKLVSYLKSPRTNRHSFMGYEQMSRKNYHRSFVISRLEHLEQLDGRQISQVHHLIAQNRSCKNVLPLRLTGLIILQYRNYPLSLRAVHSSKICHSHRGLHPDYI